jgi:hypothetical protein
MKKYVLCAILAIATASASAKDKDKVTALPSSAAAALSGKVLAVTRHKKADFSAMTAGKATFALIGGAAMVVAGNKIVEENQIADPADILEKELAPALAKQYGMTLKDGSGLFVDGSKPKEIIAVQPESDFILDLQSNGWMFAYYPTDWNTYWIGYATQAQLLDAKSGKVLSKMSCYTDTQKHPKSPGKDDMLANQAKLIKDVTASLGWICLHRIATKQLALAEGAVAATPPEFVDPLGKR